MYNPCVECFNRYGRQYSNECDNNCEYANVLSQLREHGGLDEVLSVMRGEKIPVIFLNKEHIDYTLKIVHAAKDGLI
jgi:hypothetical protein